MTLDLKALREKIHHHSAVADINALIDELTEAQRAIQTHLDTAREVGLRIERREGRDGWAVTNDRALRAEAALAHARAAALAEAAQRFEVGKEVALSVETIRTAIRALSATPATVVCVPVETWERLRTTGAKLTARADVAEELMNHNGCCDGDGDELHESKCPAGRLAAAAADFRAALAEMVKVTP